jgi:hypothetical protein
MKGRRSDPTADRCSSERSRPWVVASESGCKETLRYSADFSLRTEVDVVFARGGRNAADDAIVDILWDDYEPFAVTVVTSDRELARRVQDRGAATLTASASLRHLEETT